MIGRVLNNRYEIIDCVGHGGMADVYLGLDRKLNRNVAVKVLKEEFTNNEQFLKKFMREAQAAAKLSHPNIVNVYDVGNDGNIHYIVMEYVDGNTLRAYIKSKGKLSPKESVNYALGIASALSNAHKNNIIHRDIKPHNILLVASNKMPKVADFGIAKAITSSTLTMADDAMGSVHYISPEQARGGFLDERSDLYSLGILIYEMLTGRVPFDADTPVSVALKHIQEDVPRLCEKNPNIPKGLSQIVENLTQKSPSDRYQNTTALINELKALRNDINGYEVKSTKMQDALATEVMPILTDTPSANVSKEVRKSVNEPQRQQRNSNQNQANNKANNKGKQKKSQNIINKLKSNKPAVIGIGVLLAIILMVAGYFIFTNVTAKEVKVPDVTNLSLEDAEKLLAKAELKYTIVERKNDAVIEKDFIISQNPKNGTIIKNNRKVELVVSDGPKPVEMPNVVGLDEIQAKSKLENEGLVIKEVKREFNDEFLKGQVYQQSILAGEEVPEGTEVTLYVSKGEDAVVVGQLVGKTLDDVKKLLSEQELTLGKVTYEASDSYDSGYVIKQSIESYKKVPTQTSIDLVVSKGRITTKTVYVNLSDYTGGSSSNVNVKLVFNDSEGESTEKEYGNCSGTQRISMTVKGYGSGSIDIYINGGYAGQMVVNF